MERLQSSLKRTFSNSAGLFGTKFLQADTPDFSLKETSICWEKKYSREGGEKVKKFKCGKTTINNLARLFPGDTPFFDHGSSRLAGEGSKVRKGKRGMDRKWKYVLCL